MGFNNASTFIRFGGVSSSYPSGNWQDFAWLNGTGLVLFTDSPVGPNPGATFSIALLYWPIKVA